MNYLRELEIVASYLIDNAIPILDDDILNVATIAANNDDELGSLIQEAISAVGRDGIITVEESKTRKTQIVTRSGLEFDEGI